MKRTSSAQKYKRTKYQKNKGENIDVLYKSIPTKNTGKNRIKSKFVSSHF